MTCHLFFISIIERKGVLTMDFILIGGLAQMWKREIVVEINKFFVCFYSAAGRLESSRIRYVEVQLASDRNEGGSGLLYGGAWAEGVRVRIATARRSWAGAPWKYWDMPLIMAEYHTFQWRLPQRSVSDVCEAVLVINRYRTHVISTCL